jgi:hypothetical protein
MRRRQGVPVHRRPAILAAPDQVLLHADDRITPAPPCFVSQAESDESPGRAGGIAALWLFESVVRGDARPDSEARIESTIVVRLDKPPNSGQTMAQIAASDEGWLTGLRKRDDEESKMGALFDFLQKNTVKAFSDTLPLVHTTRSLYLKKFVRSNEIRTSYCDVFNENLNYFFIGRPGYKHRAHQKQATYWELPTCFIVDFNVVTDIKRMFPFDSGAFSAKMMPEFIQIIDRAEYEVTGMPDAHERIIGAFFGNVSDYFRLLAKDRKAFETEYALRAFDEEIKALHLLAAGEPDGVDDRRFCIELQSESSVRLESNKLLALVCPSIYLDDIDIRNHVENTWKAEAIPYRMHPLNYTSYMSEVYSKIEQFYTDTGRLPMARRP